MASGDILSCTIRADGWSCDVVIDGSGFAVGATYDFGSLGNSPASISAPKFTMTVVSQGYSASGVLGTITRTIYGTKVVRKPYPDNASNDETDSGTTLSVRVALSESVYTNDKNGGAGTSGTDPVVAIAAGWCTSGVNVSSAAVALACTNNSTLAYPKAIAQWAWGHTPAWRRVENDFVAGVIAYAGHGIAAVKITATGLTSSVSTTATVASKTDHQFSASGLHYEAYDLAVAIAGYTQGETIGLDYIAYPNVGNANSIIDTSANTTSTNDIAGYNHLTCVCNKTGALKNFAIVDPVNGNDTTGTPSAVLATAETTPYLTIGAALDDDADWVYVKTGGTPDILGSTPVSVTQKDYFIEVLPYPAQSITLARGGTQRQHKAKKLLYSGFTISCGSATGYLDGNSVAGCGLWIENSTFTIATAPSPGLGYRHEGCWLVNNHTTSGADHIASFSASRIGYAVAGCKFDAGQLIMACVSAVANFITGGTADKHRLVSKENASNVAPVGDNVLMCHNKVMACVVSTQTALRVGDVVAHDGVAVIGNIIEVKTITSSQPAMWIGGDGATLAINNCIVAHNTVVGERCNVFYNDGDASGGANVRTNIFVRNNAFRSFNIKTDTFLHPTYGRNGARVGNWAQIYGVNFSDNRYDGTADPTFTCDWDGINVSFVAAKDTTYGQLGYTTDASSDGTGVGNGNYLPAAGSTLKDAAPAASVRYQAYDLLGNAF